MFVCVGIFVFSCEYSSSLECQFVISECPSSIIGLNKGEDWVFPGSHKARLARAGLVA